MTNKIFSITFSVIMIFNFLLMKGQEITNITPGNHNLLYTGRIAVTKSLATMYYAGTYITTKFQGTSLKATLRDYSGTNTMGFIIDGGAIIVMSNISKDQPTSYIVATGLLNTTHDLIIVKRRGPTANAVEFHGLTLDDGKSLETPASRPSRRIEVYGNSVSAGTNADNTNSTDPNSSGDDNGWNSYPNRLARLLGAEIHNNAIPGIAIQPGFGYYSPTASINYKSLNPVGTPTPWEFSKYIPDLVILAYGINDDYTGAIASYNKESWKSAYKAILNDLMTKYEFAHFVFLVPPMQTDRATIKNYLQEIVSEVNSPRVHFYGFAASPSTYGHPNFAMHAAMAQELFTYVNTLGIYGSNIIEKFVSPYGSDNNDGSTLSPWKTVAYAASQLQSNQTLRIKAGTYLETAMVTFTPGCSNITIMADDPNNRPTIDFNDRYNYNSRYVAANKINHFTWDGVNIANAGGDQKGAIHFGTWYPTFWSTEPRQTDITIKNCDITYSYNAAIRWMYCDNIVIDNVYGYECGQINADRKGTNGWPHAILGYWSDSVTIKNCRIIRNHGEGVGPFTGCSNWLMEYNVAADNNGINYYIDTEIGNCILRNNIAYYTDYYVQGGNPQQRNCGVRIANEVSDLPYNAYDPKRFLVQNVEIYNNVILNCRSGIEAFPYQWGPFQLKNSIIANNTIVSSANADYGVYFTVPGVYEIKNNIIYKSAKGITLPTTATASNNYTGDPEFMSGTGIKPQNYKLKIGSPCIDAGETISTITTDYWGTERPNGLYDIGAHEYTTPIAVTGVSLNQTTGTISGTGKLQLSPVFSPVNATNQNVTWLSSDSSVITVNENGLVTGVTDGTADIIVTTEEGSFSDTCSVTVSSLPVTGVNISASLVTMYPSTTKKLAASVDPANATVKTITWSSNQPSVATVDSTGLVTGVSIGTAIITAESNNHITATCTVSVILITNLAINGTAYKWNNNASAVSNSNKSEAPGLNDDDISIDVKLNNGVDDKVKNGYECAGIIWADKQDITKVEFVQGTYRGEKNDNGCFDANLTLQTSTDGTSWAESPGWTLSPAYSYHSGKLTGNTYTFTGIAIEVKGVRICGQIRTSETAYSWEAYIREISVFADSIPTNIPGSDFAKTNISAVEFYPNPVSNVLNMKLPYVNSGRPVQVKIVNIVGRVLYNNTYSADVINQIDCSKFAKGLYVIQFNGEGINESHKFLIK